MRRREFISLVGGTLAAWPLTARAQQAAMPVIGYLNSRSRDGDAPYRAAFHRGLKEAGFVEPQNVTIEYRWAEYQYNRLPALAAELLGRNVNMIYATAIQAALPAKDASTTIPVVFAIGSDPVRFGQAASARAGALAVTPPPSANSPPTICAARRSRGSRSSAAPSPRSRPSPGIR
jgi:putative tryptophan/tyrosine transport system substrate-binding protein